jgi:signal transduction histidine kinase
MHFPSKPFGVFRHALASNVSYMKELPSRISLPVQWAGICASAVLICSILLAAIAAVMTQNASLLWPLVTMGSVMAAICGIIAYLIGWPQRDGLLWQAYVADQVRRGDSQVQFPQMTESAELQSLSLALRRMLDVLRQQKRELEALNAALEGRIEVRTRELTTLVDLSHNLATKSDVSSLLSDTLAALERTLDYASASIWGREPDNESNVTLLSYRHRFDEAKGDVGGLIGMRLSTANMRVYEQIESMREPLVVNRARHSVLSWLWMQLIDDARTSRLYRDTRSWMAVPLQSHEEVAGVLRIDADEPDFFDSERQRLLRAIGDQAGLAMHHAQLQDQARQFAVLFERTRIARDLHDAVSQTLFAANVIAGTLPRTIHASPADAEKQTVELQRLTQGALAEMRLLMFELRPDAMDHTGLGDLVRHTADAVVSRCGMTAEMTVDVCADLPGNIKMELYRIAQEGLSNVARHSGASKLIVELSCPSPRRCMLRIADNGIGFDQTQDKPGHFGLGNMRDRAQSIRADFSIRSEPNLGSEITVVWNPEDQATED